jgi:hypothetical protein
MTGQRSPLDTTDPLIPSVTMTAGSKKNTRNLQTRRNRTAGRLGRSVGWALVTLALLWLVPEPSRADQISRRPAEPVDAFAKRLLPPNRELAAKPVELELLPLGKVVVVLFRSSDRESNYTGWVLVPNDVPSGNYRKETLPPMALAQGLFDVEVKAIFGADADADPGRELCVIYSYYRTGSGETGGYATEVYKWDGARFVRLDEAAHSVVGLRNAGQVRTRLNKQRHKSDPAR